MAGAQVSELWIYPVKSCKGIRVKTAAVDSTGLRCDRVFCVVAADKRGRFLSQRTCPKMALIETSLPEEAYMPGWEPAGAECLLHLTAPG
mgnify:CR=1 FL=1